MKNFSRKLKYKINFLVNEEENEWREVFCSFAQIEMLDPRKLHFIDNSEQIITKSIFLFTIRTYNQIKNNMRILVEERLFEIKKIDQDFNNLNIMKILTFEIK